ncbi:MAG: hypothetical protein SRB1_00531 [Desulfobacteraceae bacterium Eth-SRB1]|nr:MAG: hypothetical protein SRB1_00531 [Desulfobacteraceae bacterium Eth-SRB1]
MNTFETVINKYLTLLRFNSIARVSGNAEIRQAEDNETSYLVC